MHDTNWNGSANCYACQRKLYMFLGKSIWTKHKGSFEYNEKRTPKSHTLIIIKLNIIPILITITITTIITITLTFPPKIYD